MNRPDLTALAEEATSIRASKGFLSPSSIRPTDLLEVGSGDVMLGKLMWIITEVTELCESQGEPREVVGAFTDEDALQDELADIVIRILDILGACGADVERHASVAVVPPCRARFQSPERVMMLVVHLVSHAAKAIRRGEMIQFVMDLCSVILYCEETAAQWQFHDFWRIVASKMDYNRSRPAKHGYRGSSI